jgi:hypothetical protein
MDLTAVEAGTCVLDIVAFEKRTIFGEVAAAPVYDLFI